MTESDDCMPEVVALLYTARSPTSSGRCWPKVDARTVCHVAATLHQWYTDESNGCIVRGHLEAGNKFVADENGLPFRARRRRTVCGWWVAIMLYLAAAVIGGALALSGGF